MSKRSNKLVSVPASELRVVRTVNFRDEYDTPSMMEEIRSAGRVLEPLHVRKEDMTVLKGNRRLTAVQELLADPSLPADLKANIEKLDVIFYEGLTERETTEIVLDHGSQKPLSRVEIVKAVWRLTAMMWSERDIITQMYHLLAVFTGAVSKKHEAQAMNPGPGREKFLKDWLHGTVGNYLIYGWQLGEYVKQQFLLTELANDRKLNDQELQQFTMNCKRTRISQLYAAKAADKKSDQGWEPETGGPSFNELIAKFQAEDRGTGEPAPTRPSVSQCEQSADGSSSKLARHIWKCAAGKLTAAEKNEMLELDAQASRSDKIRSILRQNLDRINRSASFQGEAIHEFIRLIVDGTVDDVAKFIVQFN